MRLRKVVVWFTLVCFVTTQTASVAGPHEEGVAAGQAANPVANTAKDGGRCCQPFGRSTIVWGAGKEYPVRGEDFAFMLFRKRNCCVGY